MKKIIMLSVALASFLVAADQNQKPLTKDEQDFNREILKRVDERLSEMNKRLSEMEKNKSNGGSGVQKLDASTLPFMQGSYTISKNGKPLLSEVYAQDSGGGDMYLNKGNNMIITSIGGDQTTYKVGDTTIKTPAIYNNSAPKQTQTIIKPAINTVSQTNNSATNFLAPPPAFPTKKEDF